MTAGSVEIAADIVKLAESGLFDAEWYRAAYAFAEGDPLVHFCNTGWRQGLRPNFYFDTAVYLASCADVRIAGVNPLCHYLDYGEAEGRTPSVDFDPAWYRLTYGITAACCLANYLARRRAEAVNPNPGFDAAWYAAAAGAAPGIDLFEDYVLNGAAAGRFPSAEAKIIAESGLFDRAFYATTCPDGAADPVYHFCAVGWRLQHRDPNPLFDTAWYLRANDDVRQAGVNPLLHYIQFGEPENRRPSALFDVAAYREAHGIAPGQPRLRHRLAHPPAESVAPADETADDGRLLDTSELFDANYYLINYPDVRTSGIAPLVHFCRYGWREGRRPNPYFDPLWYSQTYLAGDPGNNPLLHYITGGERAGLRPIVYFDPVWYRKRYQVNPGEPALLHYLRHRRSQKFSPTPWFDIGWYLDVHGPEIGGNRDPFAHYLRAGISGDIDPSPEFSAKRYRLANMHGTPPRPRPVAGADVHERLLRESLNPLVHCLLHERGRPAAAG